MIQQLDVVQASLCTTCECDVDLLQLCPLLSASYLTFVTLSAHMSCMHDPLSLQQKDLVMFQFSLCCQLTYKCVNSHAFLVVSFQADSAERQLPVFAVDNKPPGQNPAKAAYLGKDLHRLAKYYSVPVQIMSVSCLTCCLIEPHLITVLACEIEINNYLKILTPIVCL